MPLGAPGKLSPPIPHNAPAKPLAWSPVRFASPEGKRRSAAFPAGISNMHSRQRLPSLPRPSRDLALHDPSLARTESVRASAIAGKRVELVAVDKSLAMSHHRSILQPGGGRVNPRRATPAARLRHTIRHCAHRALRRRPTSSNSISVLEPGGFFFSVAKSFGRLRVFQSRNVGPTIRPPG